MAKKKTEQAPPAPPKPSIPPRQPGKNMVLHILNANPGLPKIFAPNQWQEVTASKQQAADLPIDFHNLSEIPDESFDAIWNASSLGYLYAHEVVPALQQCFRILRHNCSLVLSVADIQRIGQVLAQGRPERELYRSPAGGIAALDLMYGHRPSIQAGHLNIQIRTAFSATSIAPKLTQAGFGDVEITRKGWMLNIIARKVAIAPQGKPLVRVHEDDLNESMRIRDNIAKDPEMLKITPADAFDR